jgi:hypothetical protein
MRRTLEDEWQELAARSREAGATDEVLNSAVRPVFFAGAVAVAALIVQHRITPQQLQEDLEAIAAGARQE